MIKSEMNIRFHADTEGEITSVTERKKKKKKEKKIENGQFLLLLSVSPLSIHCKMA